MYVTRKEQWQNAFFSQQRHTLTETVTWVGNGVHSGEMIKLKVSPYHPKEQEVLGVIINGQPLATWQITHSSWKTQLIHPQAGAISMTEHLFAALYVAGIDDVSIECIGGEEWPILDGSAKEYLAPLIPTPTIQKRKSHPQGSLKRSFLYLPKMEQRYKESHIISQPIGHSIGTAIGDRTYSSSKEYPYFDDLYLKISLTLDLPPLQKQHVQVKIFDHLISQVINAKTFGFLKDADTLKDLGLIKGVSPTNTLVYDEHGRSLSIESIDHEAANHKVLDILGDLYLLGKRVIGHLEVQRGSHLLNQLFVKSLKEKCG